MRGAKNKLCYYLCCFFKLLIFNILILSARGCVKTLAQPFLMIYSPAIFPFVYAAFFSFIW